MWVASFWKWFPKNPARLLSRCYTITSMSWITLFGRGKTSSHQLKTNCSCRYVPRSLFCSFTLRRWPTRKMFRFGLWITLHSPKCALIQPLMEKKLITESAPKPACSFQKRSTSSNISRLLNNLPYVLLVCRYLITKFKKFINIVTVSSLISYRI